MKIKLTTSCIDTQTSKDFPIKGVSTFHTSSNQFQPLHAFYCAGSLQSYYSNPSPWHQRSQTVLETVLKNYTLILCAEENMFSLVSFNHFQWVKPVLDRVVLPMVFSGFSHHPAKTLQPRYMVKYVIFRMIQNRINHIWKKLLNLSDSDQISG